MPRVVNYTIQAVTAANITSVSLNLVGGVVVQTTTYELKDAGGVVRGSGTIRQTLTAGQKTNFASYLTANTVPDINAFEVL